MKDQNKNLKDMPPDAFRKYGHQLVDWVADYFEKIETYKVLPDVKPGDLISKLPVNPPEEGEDMDKIFSDIDKLILPALTHWNHPGFFAMFNSTSSGPGILAEILSAALNANSMTWLTSPASTELEKVTLDWLRQMIGLPENFWGIIYDTASTSTLHAIAAAREQAEGLKIKEKGMSGRDDLPLLRIYVSEHTHSVAHKAAVTLGLGLESIKVVKSDDQFRMIPLELSLAIEDDIKNSIIPICIVATIGTTSSTSIDPVDEIAAIANRHNIWLHVDAAQAGSAAILPEMKWIMNGADKADSFCLNPHKWMFLPVDLSVLFTKKPDILKRTFSITLDILKAYEKGGAQNYMDYGFQLGRRFRSLKLWFVIRYFGIEGLQNIIRNHLSLGKDFEKWIDEHPQLEKMAPVNFSTICFRFNPGNLPDTKLDELNESLLKNINDTRDIFLSHTKLNGRYLLRISISGIRTDQEHLDKAKQIIDDKIKSLII